MKTLIQCGRLFTGHADVAAENQTVIVEGGRVSAIVPTASAPPAGPSDIVIDHSGRFVMPGLIDIQSCTLDDPEALPPGAQIMVKDRLGWTRGMVELPEFRTYPGMD